MSCAGVNLNRLPGWERNSYGYHADDGCVYCSSATGQTYGPVFTTGDVVGCGLNLVSRSIFFTKNGINLGTATSDLPVRYKVVVCVCVCVWVQASLPLYPAVVCVQASLPLYPAVVCVQASLPLYPAVVCVYRLACHSTQLWCVYMCVCTG